MSNANAAIHMLYVGRGMLLGWMAGAGLGILFGELSGMMLGMGFGVALGGVLGNVAGARRSYALQKASGPACNGDA